MNSIIHPHLVLLILALLALIGGLPVVRGQQAPLQPSFQPLPAVTDSDDRFGIGNIYPEQHWLNLAQSAGMRWNRWEFRWSAIEPRQGRFDWDGADRVVAASHEARLSVQGILISTPRWAESRTGSGVIPSGLYDPWDSPRNTWGTFVRAIAERYRGRVQAWEVWNEPDYPQGSFGFWFASKADYYQLLKVAYRAVKSVDPATEVLVAGLMYWGDPGYLEDLLSIAQADPEARDNAYFLDGIAWHVYSRPSDAFDRVQRSRLLLQKYVGQKAIWVNEGNLPVWSESRLNNYGRFPLSGTLEEQAAWVVQWYAYALAAGADRVLMYRMHDSDEPEAWGLARSDGSLRPAYLAYQLAARYFSHAQRGARATLGDAEQIVFDRPGQRVLAVWNRTPRPIVVEAGAATTSALLVSLDGSTQTIRPRRGTYSLSLPPATANTGPAPDDYLVGGAPYIVVEDTALGALRWEESDPALEWSGRWAEESQPAASGGSARVSDQPGASVNVVFAGPTITWYTSKTPRGGIAQITLDGAPLDDVDLYNPVAVAQFPLTYTDLGPGPHRLTITVGEQHNPRAVGAYLTVDAFVAEQALAAPAPAMPPTATPRAYRLPTAESLPTVTPIVSATSTPIILPTGAPTVAPPPPSTPLPSPTALPTDAPTPTAVPPSPLQPSFQQLPGVPPVLIVPDPPTPTRLPTPVITPPITPRPLRAPATSIAPTAIPTRHVP